MDDDLTIDEARTKVELVKALVGTVWTEVADLFRGRAWLALGYASWDALCVAEFDGARIRLPREDRREIVGSLREAGLSVRAIAAATGVAPATVHDDLSGVQNRTPETTGTDGKRYPASRPAPPPEPSDVPAAVPTAAPPGPPVPASAEPPRAPEAGTPEPAWPRPPAWDPEERRQHEAEVQRIRDIEAARRYAADILTDLRTAVCTIVAGSRLGEAGLVTKAMVRELHEAIDLLEGEL
jgi:transposase-like protein